MIYIIKGKNGSGKTFLANKLYDMGFERSISCTTRQPRENEKQGYDYYFITKEKFEVAIKSGFFIEYQQVNGNYYGTPRKNLKDGIIIVASDEFKIDEQYKDKSILFYIDSPLELRYNRLINRGCSDEEIFHRFHQENSSFLYDFKGCFIDNGAENQSVNQIIHNMKNPQYINNDTFLIQQIKKYKPVDSTDKLLIFLQFEEFLMRGLYLDKKANINNINELYFNYMKKFLENKDIIFEHKKDGYSVILNGNEYDYLLSKKKIKDKGDNQIDEKEIDK